MTGQGFGPQQRQVLAVLQRSKGTLTARNIRAALQAEGTAPDYRTIASLLDELVEKGVLARSNEDYPGSPWYRYRLKSEGSVDTLPGDDP